MVKIIRINFLLENFTYLTRELKIVKSINIGLAFNKHLGGYSRKTKRRWSRDKHRKVKKKKRREERDEREKGVYLI